MGRLSLKWIDLKKATKKNKKEHKETELDKASIELFNKDIEEEIEKKKKKEQKDMEALRDSLLQNQKRIIVLKIRKIVCLAVNTLSEKVQMK